MIKRARALAGVGGLALAAALATLCFGAQRSQPHAVAPELQAESPVGVADRPRTTRVHAPTSSKPSVADAEADAVPAPRLSRLAAYPGFGHDPDSDEARFEREELEREEIIAECMKVEGYSYVPAPSTIIDSEKSASPAELERLVAEAARDPNAEYAATLPPAERETYNLALHGLKNPDDEGEVARSNLPVAGSCLARAHERVPGVFAKRNELAPELDTMEANIVSDEQTRRAYGRWSACMAGAGHPFGSPAEARRFADESTLQHMEESKDETTAMDLDAESAELLRVSDDCARQTSLAARLASVRAVHEDRFVERFEGVLRSPGRLVRPGLLAR
ncbi:MAG: hypothetical protein RL385_463 [Pseudomonadota bacterium]|jgi:hypothetical protein